MTNYIERFKNKIRIKKFDNNQPIGAWIFVIVLNIVGFVGYYYLKINHIQLGDWLIYYLISFLIERQKFFNLTLLVKSGNVHIDSVSGMG